MHNQTFASELHEHFGYGETVRFEPGRGDLPKAIIRTRRAAAEIYLHGAHVTAYQPFGHQPVLFLSRQSWFEAGKPVRGGVPICFPWFSSQTDVPNPPMHGFARLLPWQVHSVQVLEADAVTITLQLDSTDHTRQIWPHDFTARYIVTVGDALLMRLEVENRGVQPFTFTQALHTYLAVDDVAKVTVRGLQDSEYLDKTCNGERRREGKEPITIHGETDRIYLDTTSACTIEDPTLSRRLVIGKAGSQTTVLWNPWVEKAKRMPDFGDDEWPRMLCVETCNAAHNLVTLGCGQRHAMEAEVRAEAM
jgi:glucose-6-phosphate 1-epimerase